MDLTGSPSDDSTIPTNTLEPQVKAEDFVDPDFDAESFVRHAVSECIGDGDILSVKLKLLNLAERTTKQLKENVSQNYSKFIETAEEVRSLEEDMYQLRSLLSQKKTILQSVKDFLIKEEVAISSRRSDSDRYAEISLSPDAGGNLNNTEISAILQMFVEQAEFVGLINAVGLGGSYQSAILHGPCVLTNEGEQCSVPVYLCLLQSGHLLVLSSDESSLNVVDAESLRKRVLINAFDFRQNSWLEQFAGITNSFLVRTRKSPHSIESTSVELPSTEWKDKWVEAIKSIMKNEQERSVSTASIAETNPFDTDNDEDLFQEERLVTCSILQILRLPNLHHTQTHDQTELSQSIAHHRFKDAENYVLYLRKQLQQNPLGFMGKLQSEKINMMRRRLAELENEMVDRMNDEPTMLLMRTQDMYNSLPRGDDWVGPEVQPVSVLCRKDPSQCYIGFRSPDVNMRILIRLGMLVQAADIFVAYKRIHIDRMIHMAPGFHTEDDDIEDWTIFDLEERVDNIDADSDDDSHEMEPVAAEMLNFVKRRIRFELFCEGNPTDKLNRLSEKDKDFLSAIANMISEFMHLDPDKIVAIIITRTKSVLQACQLKLDRSLTQVRINSCLTPLISDILKYLKQEMIDGLRSFSKIEDLWLSTRFVLEEEEDCQQLMECVELCCPMFKKTLDSFRDCPCKLPPEISRPKDIHVFELSPVNIIGSLYLLNYFNLARRIYVPDCRQLLVEAAVEGIKLILKMHSNALVTKQDPSTKFKTFIYDNMRFCVDVTFKTYIEKIFIDITGSGSKYFAKLVQKLDHSY
ncbi:hypothetical protein ACOME3_007698 [Neoechinorhynchus agilis]